MVLVVIIVNQSRGIFPRNVVKVARTLCRQCYKGLSYSIFFSTQGFIARLSLLDSNP